MANICPKCLANMDMVGRVHRCVPVARGTQPVKPRMGSRQTTYRYRNPEKRRAYMRELMRKRRSASI